MSLLTPADVFCSSELHTLNRLVGGFHLLTDLLFTTGEDLIRQTLELTFSRSGFTRSLVPLAVAPVESFDLPLVHHGLQLVYHYRSLSRVLDFHVVCRQDIRCSHSVVPTSISFVLSLAIRAFREPHHPELLLP